MSPAESPLMGRKRRSRGCCKAMVAQLIAAGPGECPRLAGLRCSAPSVHPSCPREELGELEVVGELKVVGELRYTVSERVLYSQLTHECKVCPRGFCRHAFPTTDNSCFKGRQLKKNIKILEKQKC